MTKQLEAKVISAEPGITGFDTAGVVSSLEAKQFANAGYNFCIRYVSLGANQRPGDLSFKEANDILNSGLALGIVQHVMNAGWIPTRSLGKTFGFNAANNAKSIGIPEGVNIWLDLEAVKSGTPSQQVIDYCNAWYDEVSKAFYTPGIYVGAQCGLTGSELYYKLKFKHYWKSMSRVPDIPNRGYQMVQGLVKNKVFAVGIDNDIIYTDKKGGTALFLKK